MIKKFTAATLFLILATVFCFGRGYWRPGYVIHHNGDTVYGYIKYIDIIASTQECLFRNDMNSPVIMYKPSQISGYLFIADGPYFVSSPIKLYKTKSNKNIPEVDTLFLECLVKGKINLYQIVGIPSYYFIEKDGQFFDLLNSEKIVYDNSKAYTLEKKEYIGILSFLLQEAHMQHEIQKCKFGQDAFIEIVKNYHKKVYPSEKCIVFGDR
jgi:hypothetical protein